MDLKSNRQAAPLALRLAGTSAARDHVLGLPLVDAVETRFRLTFQLVERLARHLLDEPLAHLFPHRLELLLLLGIEERLDLLVEGDPNLPQSLGLLQSAERGVLLQGPQLLQLV